MKQKKVREQLGAINDEVKDDELVQITFNCFRSSWHHFVLVLCDREKFHEDFSLLRGFEGFGQDK